MLTPTSVSELQEMVKAHERVLAVGGRTKTRLSANADGAQIITTRALSGITEYEPSEYTFTALAGTPILEIHEAVQAKGQFLPCSALLREAGATLGGAICSGLSGPGRFRFGGLRDFLLGIRYVDGEGKLITAGGKVVKNAAGFDLPKLMVGSLGGFGILTEVTFKVFPKPSSLRTVRVQCASHTEAVARMQESAASRWELYAIDYDAPEKALYMRIGGPVDAVEAIAQEVQQHWPDQVTALSEEQNDDYWNGVRELKDMPESGCLAKVPLTPSQIAPLQEDLDHIEGVSVHYSVAGNVAGVSAPDAQTLKEVCVTLRKHQLKGMTVLGDQHSPLWLGERSPNHIETALKAALDPNNKFPTLSSL